MTDVIEYTPNCPRERILGNLIRGGYRIIPGTVDVYTKREMGLITTVYVGPLAARYVQIMEEQA